MASRAKTAKSAPSISVRMWYELVALFAVCSDQQGFVEIDGTRTYVENFGAGASTDTWYTDEVTFTATSTEAPITLGIIAAGSPNDCAIATTFSEKSIVQPPALQITKTADLRDSDNSGSATAGDVINYTFAVESTGGGTAEGVTIADPLPGLTIDESCTFTPAPTMAA